MILGHQICNTDHNTTYSTGTGSYSGNYSDRRSENGGSEATTVNRTSNGIISDALTKDTFIVGEMVNITGQEKLVNWDMVGNNTAGAGNVPDRYETVGKFTGSAQINRMRFNNSSSVSNEIGSEIVILGCDNDEADSGTNFWQELADVELSSGTSNTIDTGTFTAKKYLYLQFYSIPSGSQSYSVMRFNLDEGNNYASRYSTNGGSDASHGGNNYILFYAPLNNSERFMSAFIVNNSSKEKLVVGEGVSQNTAGAGNAPERRELTGKWANTSNSITSIQMHSDSDDDNPSRLFAAGTRVKVWGSD